MRQIYPVPGPDLSTAAGIAEVYGNGPPGRTTNRPFLRANMIASADGAAEIGGRSGQLGGASDRAVFAVLRSLADVILVGAGTARAEHYRPVAPAGVRASVRAGRPPVPAVAVVSASLDLRGSRLLDSQETIVITCAAAPADRARALTGRNRVLVAGRDRVDARAAVAALGRLGHRSVLCEGGPHLLGQLADAGLVDELCLTISPLLTAGPAGRIAAGPARQTRLALAHVLADDDGFLLTRYIRQEEEEPDGQRSAFPH